MGKMPTPLPPTVPSKRLCDTQDLIIVLTSPFLAPKTGHARVGPNKSSRISWSKAVCILYPLVMTNVAIENDHRNSGFSHWKWWFSIAMLNYQREFLVRRSRFQHGRCSDTQSSRHVWVSELVELEPFSSLNHWIGLRENLQETMVFTIKYRAFL